MTEKKHWSKKITSSFMKQSTNSDARFMDSRGSRNLDSISKARQTTNTSIQNSDNSLVPSYVDQDQQTSKKSSSHGNFNDSLFDGMYDRNQMDEDYKNSKISA